MAKKKANINASNARLPGELLVELRKMCAPFYARGEDPPSFGALLWDAWQAAHQIPANPEGPQLAKDSQPKTGNSTGHTPLANIHDAPTGKLLVKSSTGPVAEVTPEEWKRVRQLLKILRGKVRQAVTPLLPNMDSFEYITDLAIKPEPPVDRRVSPATEDLEGRMGELSEAQEELDRALEEAQETARKIKPPRSRVQRKGKRI